MSENRTLRIGNLSARVPVIQGGMGVGISLSTLAGTVAAEGGIGILSTAQIGFREKDFDENPLEANMRAIQKEVKRARELAKGGVIGVNIMVATKQYAEYVKEAVRAGVDLIISGAGLPMDLPKIVKTEVKQLREKLEHVKRPALVPIVSSKKAAALILKMWDRKEKETPDAIVIEGPRAGGHLGFKVEELEVMDSLDYDQEIEAIMETVKPYEEKYGREIPIIIAGGILNKEQLDHYLSMGAAGVQVATPFVTTKECDADPRYKQAYINCKKEDIVIVKSPVGMPGRAIKNVFLEKVEKDGRIPVGKCFHCITTCKPAEIPYCITKALIHAAEGDIENGLLFCGADAYLAKEITTVKEVLDRYR